MILYRPVGLHELELIYEDSMRAFPARLPERPVFYPVLQLEYARQIASEWNAGSGGSAGYVTQFKVEDDYVAQFETHTVGESQYEEFWIPAEELEEFNRHLIGHIKVLEAHFGYGFQGFVPEAFGLQGKNAVEQFTELANSFVYNRMDFYLEIKRNHKAIFLNYPFWHSYEFKNHGLKEKVLQGIREAWLTSFPRIPLPQPPADEDAVLVEQTDSSAGEVTDDIEEDITPVERTEPPSLTSPVFQPGPSAGKIDSQHSVMPSHGKASFAKPTDSGTTLHPVPQPAAAAYGPDAEARFSQGVELGSGGKYQEAIAELSRVVEEDPEHVIAYTSLGVAFHRSGQDDRALSCYEAALKIEPGNAEAHFFRANIFYSHGKVREAIEGYTRAIGLQPELIDAHEGPVPQERLTDYSPSPAEMYRIAKPARRILELNKAIEENPRQADLFKQRAGEYARLWNYEQAIADYSSALSIQPDDAGAIHARGVAHEHIGQRERALADFRGAMAIDPQLADSYINRGVNFGQTGNLRQAIASLTEGIRLAPENPDAYFNRGTAYFQQGDFERAIADFSSVIRLAPRDEAAFYWRGISNEEAGRQGEATADYRQFLALSRDENARAEVEGRLSQLNREDRNSLKARGDISDDRQKSDRGAPAKRAQPPDLYDLIAALGKRALRSTWFGSGADCYGETAEDLRALTDQNGPIEGGELLRLASGIRQTIQGDFQAFDPGAASPWIFIRAWDGSGFYIETDDPLVEQQLKAQFPALEEVEGADPPYQSLFIPI